MTASGNKPTKGLGKGLSALMGETSVAAPVKTSTSKAASAPQSAPEQAPKGGQATLPIKALQSGKYQPRMQFRPEQLQELADSIAHNGIMQPILVRPIADDKYEIVAGERRWRAAKLADLSEVPVISREMTDKVALELALVENIQRADLSPIEEGAGYQRLIHEFDYTQEELAEVIGKSRSHIANILRLQALPDEVKELMDNGELSMGHARALLGTKNPIELAQEVVRKGLNVRQTEALTRRDPNKPLGRPRKGAGGSMGGSAGQGGYASASSKDPDIAALEDTLSENLGLRVSIDDRGNSGQIVISYTNLVQLDEILQRLGGAI